jgi:hypothetical protein
VGLARTCGFNRRYEAQAMFAGFSRRGEEGAAKRS